MDLTHLGIHESVDSVFPPERLAATLSDLDVTVSVIGDDPDVIAGCDAVVTLEHRDAYVGAVDWIHSIQSGVDRFPFDEFEAAGMILTNSTGIHGPWIGETVAGYMLTFARWLDTAAVNQTKHTWGRPEWDDLFSVAGESLCVVGLGTLGRGIVERANGLGLLVTGVRRSTDPVDGVDQIYPPDELHEAIDSARFVAVAVPLTDDTHHLFGAAEFAAMRDDAYLMNVARGPVVDVDALVDALREGEIAGAALDVFPEEPLPEDAPLWDLDEVIVTPHIAGHSRDYYREVAELVGENVRRLDAGEAFVNRVL